MSVPDRPEPAQRDWVTVIGLLLVVALYSISFFLTAVEVFGPIAGWEAFLIVAGRPFESPRPEMTDLIWIAMYWLPNPSLWVGTVLLALGRGRAAAVAGLTGVIGGLACGFILDRPAIDFRAFREGYYCWVASLALLAGLGIWRAVWPRDHGCSTEST